MFAVGEFEHEDNGSDRPNRWRKPGTESRPRIVVSGVNLVEMGPLAIFNDALSSLATHHGVEYEIIALVHRKALFNTPGIIFIEFPDIKSSWLKRLKFEYWTTKDISRGLKPRLWFAMDNMTPNVEAESQAVYCHNPSPFYRFDFRDLSLDWKFGLFTLFYRYLYRINIKRNRHVIVQQHWMRKQFARIYGLDGIIVSHPSVPDGLIGQNSFVRRAGAPYRFFYPAYPRTFKNVELALQAARLLERSGFYDFELWLTFDGAVNKYADVVFKEFSDVRAVRWLGLLPRERVFALYGEADCLIFPSKLETWGMPITEFKTTGKPILAADLPYARETVGTYGHVAFLDPLDPQKLADMMRAAATGEPVFAPTIADAVPASFSSDWTELWQLVLDESPCAE
jgi:glycosyltransferase involved in cell wall biosynthesis